MKNAVGIVEELTHDREQFNFVTIVVVPASGPHKFVSVEEYEAAVKDLTEEIKNGYEPIGAILGRGREEVEFHTRVYSGFQRKGYAEQILRESVEMFAAGMRLRR